MKNLQQVPCLSVMPKDFRANKYDLKDPNILKIWKTLNYKGNKGLAEFWSKTNNEPLSENARAQESQVMREDAWAKFVNKVIPTEKGTLKAEELKIIACVISKRDPTEALLISAAQIKKFMWDTRMSTYNSSLERPGLRFVQKYDNLVKSMKMAQRESENKDAIARAEEAAALEEIRAAEEEAEEARRMIAEMDRAQNESKRREELLRSIGEIDPLLRKLCATVDRLPDRRCRYCSYSEH